MARICSLVRLTLSAVTQSVLRCTALVGLWFFRGLGVGLGLLSALSLLGGVSAAHSAPRAALPYRSIVIRTAHEVWGLDAPVAVFAAQIQAESDWNPDAVSHVGARGLAQFMPDTAAWLPSVAPSDPLLASPAPHCPPWAIRALVAYNLWLSKRVQGATECDRAAFYLSAYNGGLGWVQRDKKRAAEHGGDPLLWRDVQPVNAGRSQAAKRENAAYPDKILARFQADYLAWGPGVGDACVCQ